MSKIGRRGIATAGLEIAIVDNEIRFKGKESSGVYALPQPFVVRHDAGMLYIEPHQQTPGALKDQTKADWGLHRALLASRLKGAVALFERQITIVGLGFKALLKGNGLECSLGYSHKIQFEIPQGVAVTVDKSGQKLSLKSSNAELVGHVASQLRALRPPEPYKGTGVMYTEEIATLRRKEGKKK